MLSSINQYSFQYYPSYCNIKSPIDIMSGSLIYDPKAQAYEVILKLINLSNETIKSVTVSIIQYSSTAIGNTEAENIYTYKDIQIAKSEIFGNSIPIFLNNENIKDINVFVKKVVFNNIETEPYISDETNYIKLPILKEISSLNTDEMSYLYTKIRNSEPMLVKNIAPVFLPQYYMNSYWVCCCGRLNKNNSHICSRCGRDSKWQFENLSNSSMQSHIVKTNKALLKLGEAQQEKKRTPFQDVLAFLIKYQTNIMLIFAVITLVITFAYSLNLIGSEPVAEIPAIGKNVQVSSGQTNLLQFPQNTAGFKTAVINTNWGSISIILFEKEAEITVKNFVSLAEEGYYNNTVFYKKTSSFIEGGTTESDGQGGRSYWNYPLMPEYSDNLWAFRGAVCMIPDENGNNNSRFLIIDKSDVDAFEKNSISHAGYPFAVIEKYNDIGGIPQYDEKYTIFGQVVSGFDAIKSIIESGAGAEAKIISIEIKEAE